MLGVERSLLGKRWRARLADSMAGLSLAQSIELPELIGRVLAARGIAAEEAPEYLDPTLRRLLPDPLHLRDMEKAIARLARALETGEKIAIFGDYDVDGATSAALLSRFLEAVAGPPTIYIPDRLREGYGPNGTAMRILAAQDVRVVVTVDCGISAFDALAEAADAGLDVIVVDHHLGEARLPPAWRRDRSQPAGRRQPASPARRRGGRLPPRRRAQPPSARGRLVSRPGGARPPAMARSRGARHRLRRGAAHRCQPRLRAPGPHGDEAEAQSGPQGARRCRRAGGAAGGLSPGLHPGSPRQTPAAGSAKRAWGRAS